MTVAVVVAVVGNSQAQFAFIRHGEAEHNILFRNKTVEEGFKLYDPPLYAIAPSFRPSMHPSSPDRIHARW